jgi:hypothetical protein
VEFGTQKIPKLVSPVGFYDIFTDYRRYIKDLIFRTKQIVEGQYRINKADETILKQEKNRILDKYDNWLQGLNKQQLAYVDSNPQLQVVNNEMLKELNLDVAQLAESILQKQGVKLTSFEIGDTPVPIEKSLETRLSPQGENFKAQLNQIKTLIEQDKEKSKKTTSLSELKNIIDDLNLTRVNIDNYKKLQPIDKVGLEVLHGDVLDEWNKTIQGVEKRILDIQKGEAVEIPSTPVDTSKLDPPSFKPPLPKPKEDVLKDDINIVNDYLNKNKNFTNKIRTSLTRLPDTKILLEEVDAIRVRKNKKNVSRDLRKFISEYMRKKNYITAPVAVPVVPIE